MKSAPCSVVSLRISSRKPGCAVMAPQLPWQGSLMTAATWSPWERITRSSPSKSLKGKVMIFSPSTRGMPEEAAMGMGLRRLP